MSAFQHAPWRVLSRRQMLAADPWLRVWREAVQLPDGRVVDDYHLVEMPDFVVVVALTSAGRMVVERHYRHGVQKVVLGLPAGHLEPEEDPLAAAQRELLEETGYGAGDWQPLGSFVLSDVRGCATAHCFLARDVQLQAEPLNNDLEVTEILLLETARFMEALGRGQIVDLAAVSAFLLAQAARQELPLEPFTNS